MFQTRRHQPIALLPLHSPETALVLPINLAPSGVYARGTVLGEITSSANDVQTVDTTGVPTGGTIVLTVTSPITGADHEFEIDFDSSAADAQTAIRAEIGANCTVTGGALPTEIVFTFNGNWAARPVKAMTVDYSALSGGSSPTATVVHTTTGRTANTYGKYADGGSGGLDTARCILKYDCATDSAGRITLGSAAQGGPHGETYEDTPAYFTGFFATSDLTGLTTAAVADLGRMLSGTASGGVLSVS